MKHINNYINEQINSVLFKPTTTKELKKNNNGTY